MRLSEGRIPVGGSQVVYDAQVRSRHAPLWDRWEDHSHRLPKIGTIIVPAAAPDAWLGGVVLTPRVTDDRWGAATVPAWSRPRPSHRRGSRMSA